MQPSQQIAERSAKRHRNDPYCRIDLWGFVAIFVALLYLFLPGTPHSGGQSPPVNLFESSHAVRVRGADREDALTISIDRAGRYFFRSTQLYAEDLVNVIRENLTMDVERRVFIRADARSLYHDVEFALDAVRKAGIENVTFITLQSPSEPAK
jgi:biopolymer transport protein ExbD